MSGCAPSGLHFQPVTFGYSLVLAGAIYVLFGLVESRTLASMVPESLVGLFFIGLALLGIRGSLLALGVGWFLHGLWDVASPHYIDVSYLPWILEPSCVGFDFFVGVYLVLRSLGKVGNPNAANAAT